MESKIKQLNKEVNFKSLRESNYKIKSLVDNFSSTSNIEKKLNILMAVLLTINDEDYFRYNIDDLSR
jgi:hypothetical protein